MIRTCTSWLVSRLGLRELFGERQQIPFGVKPGLGVLPGLIVFTFLLQALCGFFIWMGYGASSQSAWESVYYLKYEVLGGWLLHGLHFWTAQLLLAELFAYLLYLIMMGKYRAPRELVFWSALGMTLAVLASHITGDLLTWTQNGYWSTDVRTKFLQIIPWIGPALYKLAVGGSQMSQMTLVRLQAFHIGLFVIGFTVCAVAHWWFARIATIRESEILHQQEPKSTGWNIHGLVWLTVTVLLIAWVWSQGGSSLGSPRDPSAPYAAARPHWYLAGVYEFAHFFGGNMKILPIFVIPGCVIGFYFLAPWFARWLVGHFAVVGVTAAIVVGVTYLTFQLWAKDAVNTEFQASLAEERAAAKRIVELAQKSGIPADGAMKMLWNDPVTMGPRLFKQHCVSCHDWAAADGSNGHGGPGLATEKPSAPNLYGFASREWITDFHNPELVGTPRFFGNTRYGKHQLADGSMMRGSMIQYLEGTLPLMFTVNDPDSVNFNEYDEERTAAQVTQNRQDFDRLMELFAQERFAPFGGETPAEAVPDMAIPDETTTLLGKFTCTNACHGFYDDARNARLAAAGKRVTKVSKSAADLTGYGSRAWLTAFVADPTQFYAAHETKSGEPTFSSMPAYHPDPTDPEKNLLTAQEVEMLAVWLWTGSVGPEAAKAAETHPAKADTATNPTTVAKDGATEPAASCDPKATLKTNQEVFPPERLTNPPASETGTATKPTTDNGGFDFDDFDFDGDPTLVDPVTPPTTPVPAQPTPAPATDNGGFDFDADPTPTKPTTPVPVPAANDGGDFDF